ncbi:MAG TPA: putative Ig domain-containing protein [Terriglobales bacterium]|nr:putative Ig domain-containing protein [Terriglobales bacterium]
MKPIADSICPVFTAYNSFMPFGHIRAAFLILLLTAIPVLAQRASESKLLLPVEEPKIQMWEPFHYQLRASGGTEPYHWRGAGPLPKGIFLNDNGNLTGLLDEAGPFEFSAIVRDNSQPPKEEKQQVIVTAETPLTVDWQQKAQVNGQRIDGSVKISNHTGRDLDLTFIVLAVNDIGRATAIGYQRFPLKKLTKDQELPFGETLSSGNYQVNVDVVGEEPNSKHIFRARLVTGKETVTGSF